jgi:hypothetical protein
MNVKRRSSHKVSAPSSFPRRHRVDAAGAVAAIVPEFAWGLWLDRTVTDPSAVTDLPKPAPDAFLVAVPVSPRVNSPRNNDADCVAAMGLSIR